jgi:hypothetical protein
MWDILKIRMLIGAIVSFFEMPCKFLHFVLVFLQIHYKSEQSFFTECFGTPMQEFLVNFECSHHQRVDEAQNFKL